MARDRALAIKALLRDVADRQLDAFKAVLEPQESSDAIWHQVINHVIGNSAMVIDMALDAGDIKGDDKTTDGYHTFNELYDHRITLYIALCRLIYQFCIPSPPVWRSKLHSDGTAIEGWFVLGLGEKPGKQITYHLPLARWDETAGIVELERAPEFDGHTSADVLVRLRNLWPVRV